MQATGPCQNSTVPSESPECVDGQLPSGARLAKIRLKAQSPLKPRIAELGNWNDRRSIGNGIAIRHLSGTMDEFALWDRVLSETEIKAMGR